MRDWTTTDYCNSLWISELLNLGAGNGKSLVYQESDGEKNKFNVRNVTLFGTIVEIKRLGERGFLYSVDDGTGVIVCKHNLGTYNTLLETAQQETAELCEESRTIHQTVLDDSVFNNQTFQQDELNTLQRSRALGIQSLWQDVISTVLNSETFQVGDNVLVNGRIYMYFNVPQIYINSIRMLSLREECVNLRIRLSNHEHCSEMKKQMKDSLTFDNIHHLEAIATTSRKSMTPKRKLEVEEENARKRISLVSPNLQGTMTFDTMSIDVET